MKKLFTKLEVEALSGAISNVQAGDSAAFFNDDCELDNPPKGKGQRRAIRLAAALDSAYTKIIENGQ